MKFWRFNQLPDLKKYQRVNEPGLQKKKAREIFAGLFSYFLILR